MTSPQMPPRSPASASAPPPVVRSQGSLKDKKATQESTGCEVPFVPAGGGTSFTRFKQLSTRRPKMSPHKKRTASSPSLHSLPSPLVFEQSSVAIKDPDHATFAASEKQKLPEAEDPPRSDNNNSRPTAYNGHQQQKMAPIVGFMPHLDPSEWTVVGEAEDHPGRRKASGFLQPIKHLSGKKNEAVTKAISIHELFSP